MIEWLIVCQVKSWGPLWYFVYACMCMCETWKIVVLCVCEKVEVLAGQSWNSPGKNSGVGCHSLLQGIFLTRDRTRVSCIGRWILLPLSHQGRPCVYLCIQSMGSQRVGHDWATVHARTQI